MLGFIVKIMNARELLLILNAVTNLGIKSLEKIICPGNNFISCLKNGNIDFNEIGKKLFKTPKLQSKFLKHKEYFDIEQEMSLCYEKGISIISCIDNSYPEELLNIYDPPLILYKNCLLYTSPSPRDLSTSRMPSSA